MSEKKYVSFNQATNCIDIKDEDMKLLYYVELSRCKTAGAALDWIHQTTEKVWMTPVMVQDFISVFFKHIDPDLWQGLG